MSQQYMPQTRGQQAPAVSLENQIMQMKGEFARAIGGATPAEQQKRAERFARICVTAFRQSPELQKCSPASILGAMMTCAQVDLEPNTPAGLCYLIPRWNSKLRSMECQFQLGYRGVLELLYRSGAIASFNADVVYKGELEQGLFSYTSGVHPKIEHRIDLLDNSARTGNPADIVAAYAAVVLKSGEPVMRLVTRKEIDAAMAMSGGKAGPSAVWKSHYPAMAIKTAIHRLSKWLPTSKIDDAFAEEAKYIETQAAPAEAPQASLSIEAINAMMQAGAGVAVEVPQEVPAEEQAKQDERPMAFRPAQEAQTAPKMPEPEAPQTLDVAHANEAFDDYCADRSLPEGKAREYVSQMVKDGRAPDVATAKAMFVAQDLGMDLAV